MLTSTQLLDAAKSAQGIKSEYRFARTIGVTDTTLYNYRRGRTPDDDRAAKLAELAGLDLGYVLICMAAERTKDPEARAAYEAAASRYRDAIPAPSTVDKMSTQLRTPDRLTTPMNTGSSTMATGSAKYTLEKVCLPTPAHVAGLGILAAGSWISDRRARLLRRHSSH